MSEPNGDDLRDELERVKRERDSYRNTAGDLLRKHYDIDIEQFEAEILDLRESGGIPLDRVLQELEEEFGLTP